MATTTGTQYRCSPKVGTLVQVKFGKKTVSGDNDCNVDQAVINEVTKGTRTVAIVKELELDGSVLLRNIKTDGKKSKNGHSGGEGNHYNTDCQWVAMRDLYRVERQKGDPT
jgi:hypothetical protein